MNGNRRQILRENLMRQAVDRKIEERRRANANERQEMPWDISHGSCGQGSERPDCKKR